MTLDQVLWECFRHFAHLDEANAATHCAVTKYSPITFRLAEQLLAFRDIRSGLTVDSIRLLDRVAHAAGQYDEDAGR